MKTPATGLYGPSDYQADFVTIERLKEVIAGYYHGRVKMDMKRSLREREAVKEFALDLAEDLDARGLVLVQFARDATDEWIASPNSLRWPVPLPSPNTGS